ncbi:hypothetical protein [Sorangium sp. So ce131]|uniref:hypothetical protein n=1 Tax=Sorangium sp. So ce131 TaxID=3133282 RepID=UPI003F5F414D
MMILSGFLMAGLAIVACGGEEEDEPGGGQSGELEGKQLQELTASEAQAVCEDVGTQFAFSDEDSCEVAAVSFTLLGRDCEEMKQKCLNGEVTETSNECDTSKFEGCSATVAEAKRCFGAMAASQKALTCESTFLDLAVVPPECETIVNKCPEFMSNDSEGGGA